MKLTIEQQAEVIRLLSRNYFEKSQAEKNSEDYEHKAWVRGNLSGITETLEKLGVEVQPLINAAQKSLNADTTVQRIPHDSTRKAGCYKVTKE